MSTNLSELLQVHCNAPTEAVKETEIFNCELSFLQIRDRLLIIGGILYEDLDRQIYVASLRTGFCNMAWAAIALQLCGAELHVAIYAKEGLIKQKAGEKALQQITDLAQGKPIPVSSRIHKFLPVVLAIVGLTAFVVIRGYVLNNTDQNVGELSPQVSNTQSDDVTTPEPEDPAKDSAFIAEVEQTIEATKEYNRAVNQFNNLVVDYNAAVALISIDNISGMPGALESLSLESEDYEDNAAVIQGGNTKEMIAADTTVIMEMCQQVEALITLATQLHAPTGDWVYQRLAIVDGVTGRQQVTENLNPDGLLGKDGGYSACVYFSHQAINQMDVPGGSIVMKGTDAGGAVEVYSSLEDAQARVDYLAGFDGTILYSGSYAIVGTMVIRTSYKLSDEQQLNLTDAITKALTTIPTSSSALPFSLEEISAVEVYHRFSAPDTCERIILSRSLEIDRLYIELSSIDIEEAEIDIFDSAIGLDVVSIKFILVDGQEHTVTFANQGSGGFVSFSFLDGQYKTCSMVSANWFELKTRYRSESVDMDDMP